MVYRLPPLTALRQFEAAARHLSFRSAAEELNVTASAVSHGVIALEEWLGLPLFLRDRRGLSLTPAGQAYLPRVQEGLAALARASDGLSLEASGRRRLRLSVAPSFAARWLLPNLPRFHEAHPDVEIVLDTERRRVDLHRDAVDLAVRRGEGDWPGVESECLLLEDLVPVCAPEIAARIGSAADLAPQALLHVTAASEDWQAWARLSGAEAGELDRGLRFDTLELAWAAAAQGLGVAIGRRPLVDPDLAAGRLVEVLGPPVRARTGYWLVAAREVFERVEAGAFRDWLRAALGTSAACPGGSCERRLPVPPGQKPL